MAFYAGKNASLTFSATAQPFEKFDLDFKAEVIDTTNFTSSGYQSNTDGVYSCSASFEGPYNGSTGLTQGQSIAVTFAVGGGGPSFAVTLRVGSMRISTATRNQVSRFSASAESNGSYSVTF